MAYDFIIVQSRCIKIKQYYFDIYSLQIVKIFMDPIFTLVPKYLMEYRVQMEIGLIQ